MLAHGPLSGMPLASVPRWPRTRVVVVPCQPRAVLSRERRTPAIAILEAAPHVDVVCVRDNPATAYLVSSHSVRVSRVDMVQRSNAPAAIEAVKRGPARVACERGPVAVLVETGINRVEAEQLGNVIVADTTDVTQPNVAKGEIRAKPHEC